MCPLQDRLMEVYPNLDTVSFTLILRVSHADIVPAPSLFAPVFLRPRTATMRLSRQRQVFAPPISTSSSHAPYAAYKEGQERASKCCRDGHKNEIIDGHLIDLSKEVSAPD